MLPLAQIRLGQRQNDLAAPGLQSNLGIPDLVIPDYIHFFLYNGAIRLAWTDLGQREHCPAGPRVAIAQIRSG